MDSRAKKLIEALGMDSDPTLSDKQNLIRASVEYDKLAEQAQKIFDVTKFGCSALDECKDRAAELRAMIPKEKTMVERLKEYKPHPILSRYEQTVLDALIDLYERQGKE